VATCPRSSGTAVRPRAGTPTFSQQPPPDRVTLRGVAQRAGRGPGPGARREPFPQLVPPMTAPARPLPGHPEAYAAELKWDGVRIIAHIRSGAVKLASRNGRTVSESYPDLAGLGEALGDQPAVLDGEIIAFDQAGRPNFGTLQARMHVSQPSPRLLATVPVFYYVFDLVHLAGWSTLRVPYLQRRELLDQLDLSGPRLQVPPYVPGGRFGGPRRRPATGAGGRGQQAAGLAVPAGPPQRSLA
jgi:hypothetical protein